MADIYGINFFIDIPRIVSVKDSGFYQDMVPGKQPGIWESNGVYFWNTDPNDKPYRTGLPPMASHAPTSSMTLLPATEHPDWSTSGTGVYSRRTLDEFEQTVGEWFEWPYLHSSDWVHTSKTRTAQLKTKFTIPENHGIVVHYKQYGPASTNQTLLDVIFGDSDPLKAYRLNVNENGKGYLARGTGTAESDKLAEGWLVPNRWKSLTNEGWNRLYIHPHGRNRILVTSSSGGLLQYINRDLPRDLGGKTLDDYTPKITNRAPATITAYTRAHVRLNAIPYTGNPVTSGGKNYVQGTLKLRNLLSLYNTLAPGTLASVETYDRPRNLSTVQLPVMASHVVTASPGASPQLQSTVTLRRRDEAEEDKHSTPIFYRTEPKAQAVRQSKPDESVEVYTDIMDPSFSIDEGRLSGNVTLRNIKNYSNYRRRWNIPFKYTVGGNSLFEGVLINPKPKQKAAIIDQSWDIADYMLWLEKTPIYDLERLDGYSASDAVKAVLIACGLPDDGSMWVITPTPTTTVNHKPTKTLSKGEADSDALNLSDVLKTPKDWLDYICDTYTSSVKYPFKWVYGWMPVYDSYSHLWKYKFYFMNPDTFSDTPVKSLYCTEALSVAYGNDKATAYKTTFNIEDEDVIEPEGDALLAVGMDEDETPIMKYIENRNAIRTDILPADRATNWFGDRRVVVYQDPALNTAELLNGAAFAMFSRISVPILEWKVSMEEWDTSILNWAQIRLYNYRDAGTVLEYRDMRVTGMSLDLSKSGPDPYRRRKVTLNLKCPYSTVNGTEVTPP